MHATKLVSLAAAMTAVGIARWMEIMRFFPERSGVSPEHVNKWLLVDTVEFMTLLGFASTAHRRSRHSRDWAPPPSSRHRRRRRHGRHKFVQWT